MPKENKSKLLSLSVFFPCLNEEKNVPLMVEDFIKVLPKIAQKYEIIIINDGSTDNTAKIADHLAVKHKSVRVVHHPNNQGYGASLRSGFEAAKYSWTFFTDGDHQFNVNQLYDFIPHTHKFQVVIGYRKNRAEGSLRALNAKLFKLFIDILFRVHVRDIDCAFKLIKTQLVQSIDFQSTGAMISAELLYRLKKMNQPFKQLPVDHYPRLHGTPTGNNLNVIIKAGIEAIQLYTFMKFKQPSKL